MSDANLVSHIRRSWEYAKALKVDEVFTGPTALRASDTFKALATEPTTSYEELYLTGLREGQYNFLLKDYSFFQFGSDNSDVRFAYYPNPFLGAASEAITELNEMQEYVAEGVIDVDQFLHRASEIRTPQHPPLVRYDYSKSQYKEDSHPCSHLHLGFHAENRWPIRRHLTAHAFALLIFRLFYLEFWMKADNIQSGKEKLTMDMVLAIARSECRMLGNDEFSEVESTRFHFV